MSTEAGHHMDSDVLRDLAVLLDCVEPWSLRTNSEAADPAPGSALDHDDRATAPFQVSHAVIGALGSAVDHVHALRKLIIDAHALHSRAPFTLLRAALENSAIAVWLLAPDSADERVLRRLKLQWADFCDDKAARDLAGAPSRRTQHERKDQLRDLARAQGFPAKQVMDLTARPPGFGAIVGTAAKEAPSHDKDTTLLVWQLCSGISHARQWATLGLLERSEISRTAEKVLNLRMTAPDSAVLLMTQVAVLMIHDGWRLFDRRRSLLSI